MGRTSKFAVSITIASTLYCLAVEGALAENAYQHAFRLCVTVYHLQMEKSILGMPAMIGGYQAYIHSAPGRKWDRDVRRQCSDFANNPNPAQLADFEQIDQPQPAAGEDAADLAASFLTGFIGGLGAGAIHIPRAAPAAGVVRTPVIVNRPIAVSHTSPTYIAPVKTTGTGQVVTRPTVATPAGPSSTAPVLSTSQPKAPSSSTVVLYSGQQPAGLPIGYITQPSGVKDPIYSRPPCAKTVQISSTSYKCSN